MKMRRFYLVGWQSLEKCARFCVVVDTVTGVNYIQTDVGGITPLLDANGKVIVSDEIELEKYRKELEPNNSLYDSFNPVW